MGVARSVDSGEGRGTVERSDAALPSAVDGEAADGCWDVAVVGAGPAGATAALAALRAAPGLRVLLLDRAGFPRDKSCGDGIAPLAVDVLAEVGAEDVVAGWAPVDRLELGRRGVAVARPMARPAWVVPREVLDARLVEHAVDVGARLVRQRVRSVRVTAGAVHLDDRVRAKVVVGADGAHSVLRASVGLAPSRRRALAVRGYAPTAEGRRGSQHIVFADRGRPAYAWAFDRGDGLSNVGYGELLRPGRPAPGRSRLLTELDRLIPGAAQGGGSWRGHHLPLSDWRWHQPDGPLLLAGDAAGLVNPMTGEGIYYAVASGVSAGRAAAEAVAAANPAAAGGLHRRAVRRLLGRHLRHTGLASRLSRHGVVLEAGLLAADRDQRVFDDLVEIGLGRGLVTPRLVAGLGRGLTGPTGPTGPDRTDAAPVGHEND
ncbi:MAG: geranylgeranyl reductase family protein [Nocardioidaceae bacterium]